MKYIIGGGISGLIFGYYNPDYRIINKETGGQHGQNFAMGCRLLHATNSTKKLLEDLDIEPKLKIYNIGYVNNGILSSSPSSMFRELYYKKSRGLDHVSCIDETCLSGDKREIPAFKVDFTDLIERLYAAVQPQVINGQVKDISLDDKIIRIKTKGLEYEMPFEHLVSTIPAPLFMKLTNNMLTKYDDIFHKAKDVTYVKLKDGFVNLHDKKYAYYSGREPWHRITQESGYQVAELIDRRDKQELKKTFGEFYEEHIVAPKNQILNSVGYTETNNVLPLGRYAEWNRDSKINDVAKIAQDWCVKNGKDNSN